MKKQKTLLGFLRFFSFVLLGSHLCVSLIAINPGQAASQSSDQMHTAESIVNQESESVILQAPEPVPAACYREPQRRSVREDQYSITENKYGQLIVKVHHDVIPGITPAMLLWWYQYIGQTVEYNGAQCPMYYILLPDEHDGIQVSNKDAKGRARVGSIYHLKETFHLDGKEYPLVSKVRISKIDTEGVKYVARRFGFKVATVSHKWIFEADGTRIISTFVLGSKMKFKPLRDLINKQARKEMPVLALHAWVKHNVEELGNLPNVLPLFYQSEE